MDAACDSIEETGKGHCSARSRALNSSAENSEEAEVPNCLQVVNSAQEKSDKLNHDEEKETSAKEVAIQANDYEIERVSSHLPARKKYIPLKFSDYRIFAGGSLNEEKEDDDEEEKEDTTFDPDKINAKKAQKAPSGRGRGRPRKHAQATEDSVDSADLKQGAGKKYTVSKVPSGFKCGICGRVFSLRGNAKAHLITHTDQRPFCCDFEGCGKQLRTKESLRRHQLSHLGIKMFECPECKKKFSCNATLHEHMARHTGEKPLSCNVCGRKFRQVTVLKRHVLTHSDEKPFACTVCGKRFAMKVYVQSHMKTHTGERPYICDTCNKSFAHASDLNRHKIIHTGKKPYACSVCSMRYSDASSRRRHEQEHQNKQQYMCHQCNQRFTRAGQLRSHLMRAHNTDTEAVYEVQVVDKPPQVSWSTSNSRPKLVSMLQNVQATSTTAAHIDENVGQEDHTEDNFSNTVPASTAVQVLVDTSQFTQTIDKQREILENVTQEERSKALTAVSEMSTSDQLASLQSVCSYRIIGQVDGNQIYEFQLEDGNSYPIEEIACRVNLEDDQLQTNNTPLTLIQQEDNSYTVIQQPSNITNIVLQDSTEVTDPSLQWQTNSEPSQPLDTHSALNTGVLIAQEMKENGEVDVKPDTSALSAQPGTAITVDSTTNPIQMSVNISEEDSMDRSSSNVEEHAAISEIKAESWNVLAAEAEGETTEESNYIYNPDLNSQEYYNWLSTFTEECKLLPMPLSKQMFQKISHVQKTLSDFMALPSGVITDKNNFKVLMSITHDLSDITSRHLTFMLHNLS